MGHVEQRIAEFIATTPPEAVPQAALDAAQRSALDCVGCMLAATVTQQGGIITRFALAEGGAGGSASIVGGGRSSRTMAALANGTLAHALDFDDGRTGTGHAAGMLLPVALAAAEPQALPGRDLLVAYALGLEAITHVSQACDFEQKESGFHRTSLFGTIATALVAARLLRLEPEQVQMALGAAGALAGGLCQSFGTYTKPMHSGMAAKNGIAAAMLAAEGWTGSPDILGGPAGWGKAFIRRFDYDAMVRDLGRDWRTVERQPLIKAYPCCGLIHGPMDSLLSLIRVHGLRAEMVERVEVTAPYDSMVLMYPQPQTGYQGKFSLHYAIATALIDGRLDLDSFDDARQARPEYRETLDKIRVNVTSIWQGTQRGARRVKADDRLPVVVHLKDGCRLSQSTERVRGLDSDAEVAAKFRDNAGRALGADGAEDALAAWSDLAGVQDIRQPLTRLNSPVSAG